MLGRSRLFQRGPTGAVEFGPVFHASAALITDAGAVAIGAGPVLTPVPAGAGSTFTVRNAALTASVSLVDVWAKGAAAGRIQISSPNLVPVSNGIRIQTPAGLADFLMGGPPFQSLIPQDNLSVQLDGTAAAVLAACLQSYYTDLPGGSMILHMPGDISGQTEFVFGWPVAAAAATAPGSQGSVAVTATIDSSTANRWYAVLGYVVDTSVAAVGIAGVDTSQLFIGGPGDTSSNHTRNYFADLSIRLGMPCIPMFNAANKASTSVVVVDNAASTAVNVTLIVAQMNAGYTP